MLRNLVFICFSISFLTPVFSDEKSIIGFTTISVQGFKKQWKADGKQPLKFPPRTGNSLIVASVSDHSPADKAGLQEMDIIRVINKKLIRDHDAGKKLIEKTQIGQDLELAIVRSELLNGKRKNHVVKSKSAWINKIIKLKPVSEKEYIHSCLNTLGDPFRRDWAITKHKDTFPYELYDDFSLFYTVKAGVPQNLFLRLSYCGDDWLFIKYFTIKTNKKAYRITPYRIKRDNGILSGNALVWEWCEHPLREKDYKMIEDIMKSKSVSVGCHGDANFNGFEPSKKVRSRMLIVYKSYLRKTKQ